MTRELRGSDVHREKTHHVRPDVAIPKNWKTFLQHADNKKELVTLYTNIMEESAGQVLENGQQLFVSGGLGDTAIVCHKSPGVPEPVPQLHSNQEEADIRIILHCVHASRGGVQTVVVCSPDTDVIVLLLHHREQIHSREIYFLTGKNERYTYQVRLIPIHEIFQSLTAPQLKILLPVHCMTGCDSVSSFKGHGKKSAIRIMYEKSEKYQALASLGDTHVPSDQETVCATMFVGQLYGDSSCASLNRLRCNSVKKQKVAAKKLPPTDDSFMQHLRCVCLQLMIWRQACVGMQELPNILQSGYQEKEGTLCPVMTTKPFAAPELSNDIVCDCDKDQCYNEACYCFVSDQPCGCQACTDATHGGVCGNPWTYIHLDDD